MSETADVIVVGAGMAGLEAALAIRATGTHRVVVINGSVQSATTRWRTTTPPHYPDHGAHLRLGGRSLAWHGVVLPIEPWALDDWPAAVALELRNEWYEAVESDLEAWAGAPLHLPREADAALRERLTELTSISWQLVPCALRRGDETCRAYSPLDCWPMPAAEGILSGSVVEVLLENESVAGVRLACEDETVLAPAVLLAAGTLETTRLVAQARRRPDRAYPGLVDHLVEGFLVRIPRGTLPPGGFVRWPADADGRCALFARTRSAEDAVFLDVWTMGEQLPSAASNLRFEEASNGTWTGLIDVRLGPSDEEVLAVGRRRLTEVWGAVGAGAAPAWPRFMDGPRTFAQARDVAEATAGRPVPYAWPLGTVDHEGSTLPYGSELDDAGRVADVPGLWVTGPATFTRPGAANPSLTTLALARRSARSLTDAGA